MKQFKDLNTAELQFKDLSTDELQKVNGGSSWLEGGIEWWNNHNKPVQPGHQYDPYHDSF